MGTTGATGPGVAPAYFNAVYNGGAQDVPPEGDVSFLLALQSPGDFTFAPDTTTITVNTAGVYRIDYSVTLRPNEASVNAAFAVTVNGLEHPLSFFGERLDGVAGDLIFDRTRLELTGFVIADIPAGATVTLRNKAATTALLAGTGIDNQAVNRAAILLQRIA